MYILWDVIRRGVWFVFQPLQSDEDAHVYVITDASRSNHELHLEVHPDHSDHLTLYVGSSNDVATRLVRTTDCISRRVYVHVCAA